MNNERKVDAIFFVASGVLFFDLIISQIVYMWPFMLLIKLVRSGEFSLLYLFVNLLVLISLFAVVVILAVKAFIYKKSEGPSPKISVTLFIIPAVIFLDLIFIFINGLIPFKGYVTLLRGYQIWSSVASIYLVSPVIYITLLASAVMCIIMGIYVKKWSASAGS